MLKESAWKRGMKAEYTDRPLTDTEKEFSAKIENYNLLFRFMRMNRLDPEIWYDILIIPYLNAVKKYCSRKELQIYPFWAILEKKLSRAVYGHYRAMNAQKRKPEGRIISLDYTMEGDNPFSEYAPDVYWIDPTKNVEAYVVEKEFIRDIFANIKHYADPELLELTIRMRISGFTNTEIARQARVELKEYEDWTLAEIKELIRLLTKTNKRSALSRLVDDTREYGNRDDFNRWEILRDELEM